MSNSSIFQKTPVLVPERSVFDLSYNKKFTCDMFQLIPVMCDEVVPGDKFRISNEMVIRFQPLLAPILHEINVYTHYFFVPYRLLWDNWEKFITGGVDGNDNTAIPIETTGANGFYQNTFEDFVGFPVGKVLDGTTNFAPTAFAKAAYYFIWNEYYRDQNLQTPFTYKLQNGVNTGGNGTGLFTRSWQKDYFTAALPWQQRGAAPALALTGYGTAEFSWPTDTYIGGSVGGMPQNPIGGVNRIRGVTTVGSKTVGLQATNNADTTTTNQNIGLYGDQTLASGLTAANQIDMSNVGTFDVNDLRTVFQIQKWKERNARAGVRYTEFLNAHFAVHPRDDRLDRPEFIGGTRAPVIVSEVLQTSETTATSPQAHQAGRGIVAHTQGVGSYFVQEYGLIMGLMSVCPKPSYTQGLNRQWIKQSRYDFYFREFANLSEQEVFNEEIYVDHTADDKQIFGYQGRYNEMRYKPNLTVSGMRSTFDYWHLARTFSARPHLNEDFIKGVPADTKRIFAVQNVPSLLVDFGNKITAIRPLPAYAVGGLVDHY